MIRCGGEDDLQLATKVDEWRSTPLESTDSASNPKGLTPKLGPDHHHLGRPFDADIFV